MNPNFARISDDFCGSAPVGRLSGSASSRSFPGSKSSRGRVYSVVDPNLEAISLGEWNLRMRWNAALGSFHFIRTTVLVGRVAAAGCRSITALGGADKAFEKSDRQCSNWWRFLVELFLQVKNPRCRPFVQRMNSRILGSIPSDILEPFFGFAESPICFRMRLMSNANKSSKEVDKCA